VSAPVQFAPTTAARTLAEGAPANPRVRRRHDPVSLLKRLDALKALRSQFDTHWQIVADKTWPDWGDFTIERSPGERRGQQQFDSTAAYALERFAAVLETFLTPRAQTWHELRASLDDLNDEPGVKEWFDEVSKRLHKLRSKPESGFYGAMQVAYKSHGAFGNGAISIEPGRRGGIVYVQRHIKNVWVAHDDQGRIDTVYESFKLSLKAAVQRFGEDALPEDLRTRFKIAPFDRHEFVRCIFPDDDYRPGNPFVKPFAEVTIEPRSRKVLIENGLFELPLIYSRYTLNPLEDYGRGPAMVSLADNLTLQEMEKTLLRAGQLMTRPPLLLPHDGLLGAGGQTVDLREGALNYGGLNEAGEQMIKPMITGGRPELGFEMQQQKRQNIRSAMLLDLFEILAQNPQMTATQAMLVAQERGVITAPIVGRLQQEMLGPILHRELGLAWRMGLLPDLPDALAQVGVDYRVEYTSPATRSQRIEELVGVTRTIEIAAPWIQSDPSYLEVLDGEAVLRLAAEITGVPSKVIRTKEQLAKIREAQSAARAQQEQMAQLPEMAKAAQSAASAAKDMQATPALAKGLGLA
jgi:hypothetical protein